MLPEAPVGVVQAAVDAVDVVATAQLRNQHPVFQMALSTWDARRATSMECGAFRTSPTWPIMQPIGLTLVVAEVAAAVAVGVVARLPAEPLQQAAHKRVVVDGEPVEAVELLQQPRRGVHLPLAL